MTTNQDYYVKEIETNDAHQYTTIFDSVTGAPFRVKNEMVGHYLEKAKRENQVVDNKLVATGKWIPAFVKTTNEIIGSPSSGKADKVAPVSQVKAGKRRRGRRGRKK